jgi:acyl-[acyl-carrier-protein] desaturase
MSSSLDPENPVLRRELYRLYREFFDRAERKRRWSLADDIPWDQANQEAGPAVAGVVETFCAVEMYLPDYVSKALPMIRGNRGWAWFHANWGYEESKHSLALADWLIRSGFRTEEQLFDMEASVFTQEWEPPLDNAAGMLVYAMVQELATFLHYRNLLQHVRRRGDAALARILELVTVDERSHHAFYRRVVEFFLKFDRAATLEQLGRVLNGFSMPAVYLLADSPQRQAAIRSLDLFSEDIFVRDVYYPLMEALGVSRQEMRRSSGRKSIYST